MCYTTPVTATELPLNRAKIRELREAAGLSMQQAAGKAGWKIAQQWYLIEAGKRKDPSISTVQRIARALGCSVDDLLTELPPAE